MASDTPTALITGGTSGIGRATANKLAQLGIHVLVVGRNAERGKRTIEEIREAGGKADFISSDLRDTTSAREVAKKAIELGNGHVDILINNAGIYPFGPTHEMTEEQFDRVFSIYVKVPYFLVAALAPLMAKRGKGAIVNLSEIMAAVQVAMIGGLPYTALRDAVLTHPTLVEGLIPLFSSAASLHNVVDATSSSAA